MTIMSGRPALTEGTAARDKSFSVGEVGGQVVQRLTSSWINILMIVMLMLMIVIVVMVDGYDDDGDEEEDDDEVRWGVRSSKGSQAAG